MNANKPFHLHAITLALFAMGAAQAQTVPAPNAGQVLRELQVPAPTAPIAAPAARAEPAADAATGDQTKVLVKSIAITGNQFDHLLAKLGRIGRLGVAVVTHLDSFLT